MGYNSLANYYQFIFNYVHIYKFCSISEVEQMIPFERDVYFAIMKQHIEKMNEDALQDRLKAEAKEKLRF